jgi:hypothetical protein
MDTERGRIFASDRQGMLLEAEPVMVDSSSTNLTRALQCR